MSQSRAHPKQLAPLIHDLRGQRVMLSGDLARLYGVEARVLMQAVKRNRSRFPPDFMFLLDGKEVAVLKSHVVTSSWGGARRANPYAFTEQGVAMLSSVLRSERAVEINIAIMRTFVRLREALSATREMSAKLNELEQRVVGHDEHIQTLFEAIRQLMTPPDPPKRSIGFHAKEPRPNYQARRVRRK